MQITILGPGRLGRSLAALLSPAHEVALLGRNGALPAADVVLLCVPDRAIAEVSRRVPRNQPVLHCSGATGLDVLGHHPERGSFHPLMTFPGPQTAIPELRDVFAAVDGTPVALDRATQIAHALGMRPVRVAGDRRLYHAAAVIAGNLATVLLARAAELLTAAGVDQAEAADALLPLAIASLRGATPDPARALTGPVARGDDAVLEAHRVAMAEAGYDALRPFYDALITEAKSLIQRNKRP